MKSIISMLEGNTPRQEIINYIKEYGNEIDITTKVYRLYANIDMTVNRSAKQQAKELYIELGGDL